MNSLLTDRAVSHPDRLAALDALAILDTPAEPGFDDVVRLATRLCSVPVALVSLVSRERQWFKARVGFDASETDLDRSVCKLALTAPDLLTIPDLAADPRTAGNPLVSGDPHIRFYAGAPLRLDGGLVIGSLCVIDTVPRPEGLTPEQADDLRALARQVVAQLDLRIALRTRNAALAAEVRLKGDVLRSESRYRSLFEKLDTGFCVIEMRFEDEDGGLRAVDYRFLEVNPAFAAQTGLADAAGCWMRDLAPDHEQHWFDLYGHVALTGEAVRLENGAASLDRWYDVQAFRVGAPEERHVAILFNDISDRRAAEVALRASDTRSRLAQEAGQVGTFELDVATDEIVVSAEYCRLHGLPVAPVYTLDAVTAPVLMADRATLSTAASRADGSAAEPIEYRIRRADDGALRWIARQWQPTRDERGTIVRWFGTVRDVTERHVAQESLRVSEERLSLAFEASGSLGWWDWDIPNDRLYAGEHFARMYGVDPALAVGGAPLTAFVDGIHPDDRGWVGERIQQALDTGGEFTEEYRLLAPDGTVTWVYARGRCYHDAAGRPLRFPGVVTDITEAKHAGLRQEALLKLGDHLRDLDTVADFVQAAAKTMAEVLGATRAGYGLVNPVDETIDIPTDWCAPTVGSLSGAHAFRDYGSYIDNLKRGEIVVIEDVTQDPRCQAMADMFVAIGVRSLIDVPVMERDRLVGVGFVHYARARSFRPEEIAFIRTVTDRVQVAVARVQAEQQRVLLNGELSHRLKNTLAMVQGIAGQTLRAVPDQAPVKAFTERLIALSRAHDVLMQDSWAAAPIRSIVEKVLALQTTLTRFRIAGPTLALAPQATLSLSLLLHELATNAIKYGALSVEGGIVHVAWRIEEGAERTVVLEWRERGGPPATAPTRRGFGARLIQTGLLGTRDTHLDYTPTGLDAEFRAPISQVVAS
ncbi:PAS domain S-box-containing protein [Methylobacterium phyllostachyos]|uniref:Blue-light-activated histidine kinase n=1 Tax=Methylobacterium phyllostachyos TaxID=582672 RepID=A0A1G9VCE9_9HYPH|nr:PAS domain-containing protein [Methylobacterium phyllostachyos]SDM69545.1 PAS domain S-box-containing protein [Methylobacterium phyllostachyos]